MLMPEEAKKGYLWVNGEFKPWAEATTHLITHGLHYASSVFEGERAYNSRIFKSLQHTERLFNSANILGMKIPFSIEDIEKAKKYLLKKNNLDEAYIRAFVWRGGEEMGISAQASSINVAVGAWYWPCYFPEKLRNNGIKLATSKWLRPDPRTSPVQAKAAGGYMIGTMSKHTANDQGYHDALLLDYKGRVGEASGANLFMIKDGVLKTPTTECVLNGITRQTIIALAKDNNITVEETDIMPDELYSADEVFLTGTAAEITAVGEIDGHTYIVGDVTNLLRSEYEELVRR